MVSNTLLVKEWQEFASNNDMFIILNIIKASQYNGNANIVNKSVQ